MKYLKAKLIICAHCIAGWWCVVVGHFDSCTGNQTSCQCDIIFGVLLYVYQMSSYFLSLCHHMFGCSIMLRKRGKKTKKRRKHSETKYNKRRQNFPFLIALNGIRYFLHFTVFPLMFPCPCTYSRLSDNWLSVSINGIMAFTVPLEALQAFICWFTILHYMLLM